MIVFDTGRNWERKPGRLGISWTRKAESLARPRFFADGHAIMWDMTVWGAEQRAWTVSFDRIDSQQFSDCLTGASRPGNGS